MATANHAPPSSNASLGLAALPRHRRRVRLLRRSTGRWQRQRGRWLGDPAGRHRAAAADRRRRHQALQLRVRRRRERVRQGPGRRAPTRQGQGARLGRRARPRRGGAGQGPRSRRRPPAARGGARPARRARRRRRPPRGRAGPGLARLRRRPGRRRAADRVPRHAGGPAGACPQRQARAGDAGDSRARARSCSGVARRSSGRPSQACRA